VLHVERVRVQVEARGIADAGITRAKVRATKLGVYLSPA
jgi:hypothetical protein